MSIWKFSEFHFQEKKKIPTREYIWKTNKTKNMKMFCESNI